MRWASVMLALVVSACGQVQFPDGRFEPVKQPDNGLSSYELSCAEVMEFREGRLGEYVVSAKVPAPGKPIVKVDGLPPGAVFLADSSRLSWVPPLGAATDPADPTGGFRLYKITLTLASDQAPAQTIQRGAALLVRKASLNGGRR